MYVSQLRITRKQLNVDAIALRMRNESAKTKIHLVSSPTLEYRVYTLSMYVVNLIIQTERREKNIVYYALGYFFDWV